MRPQLTAVLVAPRATLLAASLPAMVVLAAAGCRRPAPEPPQPVVLGPENVTQVRRATVRTGPSISGRLEPRRQAAIAAQVGGTVLETAVDAGQRVEPGQLLARIGDETAAEQLAAARIAQKSAASALETARGELARSQKLHRAGGIATRDLERAQSAVTAQEAQLAQAKAAVARAEQAQSHTEVRASIQGVVSERRISAGDVVAPGTPLFTLVDPTSLRFVGLVPAADIDRVRLGARVDFEVTGQRRAMTGQVEEVSPVVDRATGQARVFVTLPADEQGLLGGLFADGRVTTQASEGLAAPADAIDTSTSPPAVMRVTDGVVERVVVRTGLRDEVSGLVAIDSGVSAGDVLVLASARGGLASGTRVELSSTTADH